jgi:transcription antitermination factor NusG
VKEVETPLFSTYLFVKIDPEERLPVLEARGAVALLGAAGRPTPVPEAEVESLRTLALAAAPIEPHPYLRAGRLVRVKVGALRGVEGRLVRRKGRARIVIAIDVLRQAAALEVDVADVEAV